MSPTETVAAIAIEMACGEAVYTVCDGAGRLRAYQDHNHSDRCGRRFALTFHRRTHPRHWPTSAR